MQKIWLSGDLLLNGEMETIKQPPSEMEDLRGSAGRKTPLLAVRTTNGTWFELRQRCTRLQGAMVDRTGSAQTANGLTGGADG